MHVYKIWINDLTQYQIWYKLTEIYKAFRHFLTANRKKTSQRIICRNSGCKRKLWGILLPRVICENSLQTPGSKLKTRTKAIRLRNFRDTLIVFLNENCFFCICFTELYFFYWLLVVSLGILTAVPFVFSRSWTSLAGVLKMPRVSNAFKDYTSF